MGTTAHLQNLMLNYAFRNVGGAAPSALYVALCIDDPLITLENELVFDDYARQPVTFNASLAGTVQNSADLTFSSSAGPWGSVTYYAIFDALTNGNLLLSEALEDALTINAGDPVVIAAGTLSVSLG